MTLPDDHQVARRVAEAAGRLLLGLRGEADLAPRALGALGDATANALIQTLLAQWRPDDAVLSEETAPDPRRLGRERVWIVDPLDGSREFGEVVEQRPDWAVHVALSVDGHPSACAVALPARGLSFGTQPAARLPAAPEGPLRILVSRSRPPALAKAVARRLLGTLIPLGSAGAKAMAVLQGDAHAYLHAGGQYEWDSCAPVGVALAAGLHASRIDGSPCVYNQPDPGMPDLLICRPEWAARILAAIAAEPATRQSV